MSLLGLKDRSFNYARPPRDRVEVRPGSMTARNRILNYADAELQVEGSQYKLEDYRAAQIEKWRKLLLSDVLRAADVFRVEKLKDLIRLDRRAK